MTEISLMPPLEEKRRLLVEVETKPIPAIVSENLKSNLFGCNLSKKQWWSLCLIFAVWPALTAWLLQDMKVDPIGSFFRAHFFYPSSMRNITEFWFRSEPIHKSIYLNCWYINAWIFGAYQFVVLIRDRQRLRVGISRAYPNFCAGKLAPLRWFFISLCTVAMSSFILSEIFFAPATRLSPKPYMALYDDFVFYLFTWFFYPLAIGGLVMSPFAFIEAFRGPGKGAGK